MAIDISFFTPLNTHLNMYQCGMETCTPGHFYGPAVRDHFLIHYIVKGKGFFQVGDKLYNLEAGNGFLICPDVVTYYQADMADPWIYRWVGFHGLKAEAYLKRAKLSLSNPIFKYDADDALIDCFNDMFTANSLIKTMDLHHLSLLYLFISILIENSPDKAFTEDTNNKKQAYIQSSVEFIKKNYSRKITIQEISQSVNLDRSYFGSIFKQYLNLSPQEFLILFRMNKACDLMRNRFLSIADISRSVGYDDQFLFSKVFKKVKGVSPQKYRNTISQ